MDHHISMRRVVEACNVSAMRTVLKGRLELHYLSVWLLLHLLIASCGLGDVSASSNLHQRRSFHHISMRLAVEACNASAMQTVFTRWLEVLGLSVWLLLHILLEMYVVVVG